MKNYSEVSKIKEVTEGESYFSISLQGGMCCGMSKEYNVIPKKGDVLTVHTKGSAFGTIRGMDLNGQTVFWKTDEDLESERQEWLKSHEEKKQREFVAAEATMNAQYEALPDVFKQRIDRFRANNDRFRIDYEPYELFCCEQAVLIAEACKTEDAIIEFKELGWEEQVKAVPGLSDGHSGNTFGSACALAFWYLKQPDAVVNIHGALSPLVGSDEYGDIAR